MNLRKAAYLIAALECGSFSAAARKTGLTQSGLNREITSLEKEIGMTLLARGKRGVLPAKGAEAVIAALERLLADRDRVAEEVAAAKGLLTGSLSIGTYYSVSTSLLPRILREFAARFPAIALSVREGSDEDLQELMAAGEIDCAIISRPAPGCDAFPLLETEYVAWIPEGHPLAAKDAVRPEDLAGKPFVYPRRGRSTDIDAFFERHRSAPPRTRVTTDGPYSAWAMVSAGLGLSVNNRLQSEGLAGGVAVRPFSPSEKTPIVLALPSLAAASPALIRFVSMARIFAKEHAGEFGTPAPEAFAQPRNPQEKTVEPPPILEK